jgi:hypothetical protein
MPRRPTIAAGPSRTRPGKAAGCAIRSECAEPLVANWKQRRNGATAAIGLRVVRLCAHGPARPRCLSGVRSAVHRHIARADRAVATSASGCRPRVVADGGCAHRQRDSGGGVAAMVAARHDLPDSDVHRCATRRRPARHHASGRAARACADPGTAGAIGYGQPCVSVVQHHSNVAHRCRRRIVPGLARCAPPRCHALTTSPTVRQPPSTPSARR